MTTTVQEKLAQRARRKGVPNQGRSELEFPLSNRLFWHDGRPYTLFKSSLRYKGQYRYYMGPATEAEKAAGLPPFNLSVDEVHRVVTEHLRQHFKDPTAWLPMVQRNLPDDCGLDEGMIRGALLRLDEAWNLFTEFTVAGVLFQLIQRVTLYPDGMRIEMNVPGLIQQIKDMAELPVAAEEVPKKVTRPHA